jgi:hypothetical protein
LVLPTHLGWDSSWVTGTGPATTVSAHLGSGTVRYGATHGGECRTTYPAER